MQSAQEARSRARSPFVAAVLSLFFPGLGHAYAGAYYRALGFAAAPILILALVLGIYIRAGQSDLLRILLTPGVLPGIFVFNLIALAYRIATMVDAYRVTAFLNALAVSGGGRLGRPRIVLHPVSVAGLLAAILIMSGGHAVVARYDLVASDFIGDPCVFLSNTASNANCDDGSASVDPSASQAATPPADESESPEATASQPPSQGTPLPDSTVPPWDGTERLNILLIGSDQRPREGTYNTDTLIVVSIDPTTKQVAMFSLPRDSSNVPLPAGPLRNAYGSTYPQKINSLFTAIRNRPDLVSGNNRTRGYNGLKAVLGELYKLDIKYFVEVNFTGFKKVVDAMGGVTINVQIPVVDESYPSDTGRLSRVYIPSGIQHMTGSEALVYARSRHSGQGDFDRAARQQRVLTSLREQADIATLVPRIPELLAAVKATVKTDIPQGDLAKLAGLADSIDTKNIRSYVFSYPRYGTQQVEGIYKYFPNVARIRAAVANAFKADPKLEERRAALGEEGASVWVLNGSGNSGQATAIVGYLEYYGLTASAPRQAPDKRPSKTQVVVYNGAESGLTSTIAFLEKALKTKVVLKNDATIHADIVITTAASTPNLTAPSGP